MTDDPGCSEDRLIECRRLLEIVIRDKEAARRAARARTWPEKVAAIERLRDATRLAKAGMTRTKADVTPPAPQVALPEG